MVSAKNQWNKLCKKRKKKNEEEKKDITLKGSMK